MAKIYTLLLVLLLPKIYAQCPPDVSAAMSSQTLMCSTPTILATGTSTTTNTVISWLVPGNPSLVAQPTIIVGPPTGPPTNSVSLAYANYTVVATNTAGACQSTSVIVVNQNFKPPVSSPTVSIGTPTAIYCIPPSNPVVLSVGISTTTSGGPGAIITNPCWAGPVPQTPTCGPGTYSAYVPGTYTLTVMDSYNSCSRSATVFILDRTQPPVLTVPNLSVIKNCGQTNVTLQIILTGTVYGGVRYLYTQYPPGASFNPTNAIVSDPDIGLSGTSNTFVQVDSQGAYFYKVTNTLTGCFSSGTITVLAGAPVPDMTLTPSAPSCSGCCNGAVNIVSPPGFTTYSVSANQGITNGNPVNYLVNLCAGITVICFTNTETNCTRCDSVIIEEYTVGLKEKVKKNEAYFILYPNPTSSVFYIKNTGQKNGTVKIFNVEGKEMETLILESNKETPISNLKAGIYFVEIRMENSVARKKVVVLE